MLFEALQEPFVAISGRCRGIHQSFSSRLFIYAFVFSSFASKPNYNIKMLFSSLPSATINLSVSERESIET